MEAAEAQIVVDPEFGYRRLEPIPEDAELSVYYQSQYYDLIRKGQRLPDIRRLMSGGADGDRERLWFRATLYADMREALERHAPGRRVLDVGCGIGELLAFLNERGFQGVGLEPSTEAVAHARARGLTVHEGTFESFLEQSRRGRAAPFDAVTLMNVLEHVPRPAELLRAISSILAPGGVVGIRVPNDFSPLQMAAHKQLNKPAWWIAPPEHINYFDFTSLRGLLERVGYAVVHQFTDFPMELFLLMGDDYAGNPEAGARCHEKRRRLELAIPEEVRRRLYEVLPEVGVGRSVIMFGRRGR